jgi:murein DD-endopeptidase MepM/ murein hydrolase activator NlpD
LANRILCLLLLLLITHTPDGFQTKLIPSFPTIPTAPISQTFGHLKHTGIDFKVPVGSEVYADLDGIVTKVIYNEIVYGNLIMIEHPDGYTSLYGHLSEIKVKVGDKVKSGDLIALSGGDPNDLIDGDGQSSSAHLHWEVRKIGYSNNNKYNVDPMAYLMSFNDIKYKIAYVHSFYGLNVRASPNKDSVWIYSLWNGEKVQVVEERGDWSRLNSLRPEWVLSEWLK